ncbi:TetR/AcrR family transcriptional regulator [Galbitalea sp. SE-J8]|uniref:TetR/AcrR family transcriptional regulator n=1 Tax=Galbitalea sp. SE-J8 TaxID=3054952 RepID=UPI00259C7B54|nr:TetR/AcrR family transcriptional regulator [Galbitalea sp. SE-J8]MDM4762632.1 TetR/AcrR family transcriptional regulator [Galbitalea sp. SE-J8]
MTPASASAAPRMRSDERRALILDAAMDVFGDRGYVGATTDQVARAAGVSQPYVVRMFGSKQQLYVEVLQRALDELITAFEGALEGPADEIGHRMGRAYATIAGRRRGLVLSLMHAFVLGAEPVIGECAREGFLSVYRFLRERAGLDAPRAVEFLSGGMLINTLIGLQMVDEFDGSETARELLDTAIPNKLDLLMGDRS